MRLRGFRGGLAFVAALTLVVMVVPDADASTDVVRVFSFNVCGQYQTDCRPTEAANDWADRVARQVRDWDSDVAVFQEMCSGQRELLKKRLPAGYQIAWWTNRTDNGCDKWIVPEVKGVANQDFGDAVFVRTGAKVIPYTYELPELWDQGRTSDANREEKRELLCLGGVVKGRDSLACTVHLDNVSVDQGIPDAVATMTTWAAGRPIILAGDFNADPYDPNMGALYAGGGGTGAFREVDERDRDHFTAGCRQLSSCRSGEVTTFSGTDEAGQAKQARKFDYMFGSAHQVRWLSGGTVDPGFSRRDHKILRGEAVWLDDRQPPAVPVAEPAGVPVVPDSRSGWSGAFDIVAGRFTPDRIDDLVVRWYDGAVDLYPGRADGTLDPPVVVRSTRDGGWSDATDLAAGDFDNDGYDDLAVRWSRNSLFVYDGRNGLRDSTPVLPVHSLDGVTEITAGDVDGDPADHRDSLVIRRADGSLAAFEIAGNAPAPTMELLGKGRLSDAQHIAVGDAYGPQPGASDGHGDLFVRWNSGSLHVFPGARTGFSAWQQVQPGPADGRNTIASTTLGDFDGDGRDDIVTRARRQSTTPTDEGQLHRYVVSTATVGVGVVEKGALAVAELGYTDATHVVVGSFTAPGSADVLTRWTTGTITPRMAPDGHGGLTYVRWDKVSDMARADLVGDARDDIVVRQGTDTVRIVATPFQADDPSAAPGTSVPPPPGGWCGNTAVAELTAGDIIGDERDDLVLRCTDGTILGYPVTTDLMPGTRVVIRPAGDTGTRAMHVDRVDDRRAVVLRTADGAASARLDDGQGGFTSRNALYPAGTWAGATDLMRDAKGALLARWTSGGVWRYPANPAAPTSLAVRSFDESGVAHVRYAFDAPSVGDAAGWADVRLGRAVIPFDGLTPGTHTVRVVAVDRSGNRSGELVREVTVTR